MQGAKGVAAIIGVGWGVFDRGLRDISSVIVDNGIIPTQDRFEVHSDKTQAMCVSV